MLGAILNFLGSGIIQTLSSDIKEAYEKKLAAETDEKKLELEAMIQHLTLRQQLLIEEQKRWLTAWIRPMIALPVIIFIWKVLVWDTVLRLDTTPYPGSLVQWIVVTVIGAYMLTRPFENAFRRK